ncbi:MAG: hypothetical protein OHK0013_37540 [Sandaracinaceae bacterium]
MSCGRTFLVALFVACSVPTVRADCEGGACREVARPGPPAPETLPPGARELVRYLDAWAGARAMLLRYGARHPDLIARVSLLATLASELDAVRAAGATIDRAAVEAWLGAALADVEARLLELGNRCGPQHLELRGAEARRDALREALARVGAGDLEPPALEPPQPGRAQPAPR